MSNNHVTKQNPTKSCVVICSAIFAVLILICTTITTGLTSVLLFIELSYYFSSGRGGDPDLTKFFISVLILAVVLSVIAFAFSIVLVVGVFKRKPGLVMAYFVYGVVMTAVTLVGSVSIVFMFALEESFTPRYIVPCLGGLVIYSVILWMIWKTYKKLKTVNLYIPATANTVQIDVNKKQNEITINYFDSESID